MGIIICGHYGCGGIKAVMDQAAQGVCKEWLNQVEYDDKWDWDKAAEDNVLRQKEKLENLLQGKGCTVHALIYNFNTGLLKQLKAQ